MALGTNTQEGFIPGQPTMEDLLRRVGFKPEEEAAKALAAAANNPDADLKRCYVQVFSTPAGEKILEDLLNRTLRRSCSHPDANAGIEQEALYGRERRGQNSVLVHIAKMIVDGSALPAAGAKKRGKKS